MLRVKDWLNTKYKSQFYPAQIFLGADVRSVRRIKDDKHYIKDQVIFVDGNEYMIKFFKDDLIHVGVKIAAGAIVYDDVIEINKLF